MQPAPMDGFTLAEAIAINERSHRFEDIERMEADGAVVSFPPGRNHRPPKVT